MFMRKPVSRSRGASGGTYALLVGLISVVALSAVSQSGESINGLFSKTSTTLSGVAGDTAPDPSASASASPAGLTGTNCRNILDNNPTAVNGAYMIDPDGGGPLGSIEVECDMTNGGRSMLARQQGWGSQGSQFIIFADMVTAQTGSHTSWTQACGHYGKIKYSGNYIESGTSYGNSNYGHFGAARSFTQDVIATYSGVALDGDLLVLHNDDSNNCWAHEADGNSMTAFDLAVNPGDVTSEGAYAYCRNGSSASKRYHIFLCQP